MNTVNVYILPVSLIKENYDFVLSFVDEKRREKAEKFVNEKDRLLSLGAGYLLKRYLPQGEIKESKYGKLYLDKGPYFNVSHSGDYIALAISETNDVGVDVEKINEDKVEAIKYILNESEKQIEDVKILYLLWSNKESIIKCLSTGLKDIREVNGLPLDGKRTINRQSYYTKSMILEDYSISVTIKGKDSFGLLFNQIGQIDRK